MSENALYIAFEGIDGSGKSTQINNVSELLKTSDYTVLAVPFKPFASQCLRDFSTSITGDKGSMRSIFDLSYVEYVHACDQVLNYTNLIKPNLAEYDLIIQDRSKLSRVVNAKYARTPIKNIENILSTIPDPDVIIYLKINPKVSLRRLTNRGKTTADENLEFLTFASSEYETLLSSKNCLIIDANKSQIEISKEIFDYIVKYISQRHKNNNFI